ncbi:MAG TPA: carbon storage regulator [Gammaproteobacteria bacterium]|nr:carbon storage regulator [Gammaproteobacteria bacterium]
MLVVSRKENESIRIEPVAGLDPALTLREAFAGGAITVRLQSVGQKRVRLVIEAPAALKIMRTEVPCSESAADGERGAQPSVARAGQG